MRPRASVCSARWPPKDASPRNRPANRDAVLAITSIPDEALITINSLEILGIIYLAIAVSKLRERIARIEGKTEQAERDHR